MSFAGNDLIADGTRKLRLNQHFVLVNWEPSNVMNGFM